MEGGTLLYPEKTDAQVEAELAQTTRQIQMLANGQDSASGAATAAAEDCARAPLACPCHKAAGITADCETTQGASFASLIAGATTTWAMAPAA